MGTITNNFTCIEAYPSLAEYSNTIYDINFFIKNLELTSNVLVTTGYNGMVYIVITPSGSKDGWENNHNYETKRNALIDYIESKVEFSTIKECITSCG